MEASSNLEKFLVALSQEADLMDLYTKNPHEAMEKHDLSKKEQAAVLTGDTKKIQEMIGMKADTRAILIIDIANKACD